MIFPRFAWINYYTGTRNSKTLKIVDLPMAQVVLFFGWDCVQRVCGNRNYRLATYLFAYIEFSPGKVMKIAKRTLKKSPDKHELVLAFREDQPACFVYCTIGEYHIGYKNLVTTIHNSNVMKSMRGSLGAGCIALGLSKVFRAGLRLEALKKFSFTLHQAFHLPVRINYLNVCMGYKFIGAELFSSSRITGRNMAPCMT